MKFLVSKFMLCVNSVLKCTTVSVNLLLTTCSLYLTLYIVWQVWVPTVVVQLFISSRDRSKHKIWVLVFIIQINDTQQNLRKVLYVFIKAINCTYHKPCITSSTWPKGFDDFEVAAKTALALLLYCTIDSATGIAQRVTQYIWRYLKLVALLEQYSKTS